MKMTTQLKQGTQEWVAARSKLLTASNFAAAMGTNRYKSRAKLWKEYKLLAPPFEGNDATRWGTKHEPLVLSGYENATRRTVTRTGLHIHPHIDWLGCSPDGLIAQDGGIEIKCPYHSDNPHRSIPEYYMPQIQGSLEITGREWWDYVSWTPNGTTCFRVYRTEKYWNWAFPLLREFWVYVLENRTPPRLNARPVYYGSVNIQQIRIDLSPVFSSRNE